MNDEMLAADIKKRIDALQKMAEWRLDFIEERGFLGEFGKFLAKKYLEVPRQA